MLFISIVWLVVRATACVMEKRVSPKREAALLLVYVCIVVVARFTFFPFSRIDGEIQPLIFDFANAFPPRLNLVPFVYLFDYPTSSEALLNIVGNTTMFIPLGIVWPSVFKKLDTPTKVLLAGFGVSLTIEIAQLFFVDRVTDIDDLILNFLGYLIGYLIYRLARRLTKGKEKAR